jgi:pimeloyl-ACP methyl ester carboxylesterase
MTRALQESGSLEVAGQSLEYRLFGASESAFTLVLLHEGLGSASTWGDFPAALAQRTGAAIFAYSRAGYGQSSPVTLPRPLDYMQREALDVLPPVLRAIGFERGILVGHSDGASIATIYAGSVEDHRIAGLILLAPHFFVQEMTVNEIARVGREYESSGTRARLARHHRDVDATFRGWHDAWVDPAFRTFDIRDCLPYIRVPALIIQGTADQYGTLRQVEAARDLCTCPVEVVLLDRCGHSPHREQPAATLAAIAAFVDHLTSVSAGPSPARALLDAV